MDREERAALRLTREDLLSKLGAGAPAEVLTEGSPNHSATTPTISGKSSITRNKPSANGG